MHHCWWGEHALNLFIDTPYENKLIMIVFLGRHYYTVLFLSLNTAWFIFSFLFLFTKEWGFARELEFIIHNKIFICVWYVFTFIVKRYFFILR